MLLNINVEQNVNLT